MTMNLPEYYRGDDSGSQSNCEDVSDMNESNISADEATDEGFHSQRDGLELRLPDPLLVETGDKRKGQLKKTKRSMTLSVPESAEVNRVRQITARKMSLGNTPLLPNGVQKSISTSRRTSLADAFSESIRTLASTARRNSSPLSRKSTKKLKKSRLVGKNGICNVYNTNVPKKDRQYLRDLFTTLIDVKWRYMLFIFTSMFAMSWTIFATLYYLIALVHGDFSSHRPSNWTECIANIDGFYSAFLFAVETHHTIGYGHRFITTECLLAGFFVGIQAICALLLQSFLVGLVFAKMARPKKRAETIIFSDKAVICLRDGQMCFLCRVGDMRNTHLVEAHVRLQFIRDRETLEGEIEPLHQFEMKVGPSVCDDDRLFLVWPTTLCHVIDRSSPLYNYNPSTLLSAQFEIIVLLEGIVESTGMTAQAKTSYLPSEIMWGYRFRKLVTYQRSNGSYQVDYNMFNSTYPVKTPTYSAAEYHQRNPNPKDFFCHDSQENRLEDSRSWESTPAPSPSPYSSSYPASPLANHHTNRIQQEVQVESGLLAVAPPTIVVQCPSTCSSPNHLRRARNSSPNCLMGSNSLLADHTGSSISCSSTRPSTALSDLEEECSDHGSPHASPTKNGPQLPIGSGPITPPVTFTIVNEA